ncbi:protein GVQW3-like [Scleropages formosus]|uniref:protein GVQW3-like n=1 Tax=Scleropages formosus TaxID=113540 RepID=UPI0010FAAC09|nr:protein GVQW3-like [Scleropages formosus]
MSTFEQRANIKFCQLLGKSATETLQMLQQAHGDQALSRSVVFAWHRRFREGRESLGDDDRSGRPVSSRTEENIRAVQRIVRENQAHTIDSIAKRLNISHGSCHAILTQDLRTPQRLVHRMLAEERLACGDTITAADDGDDGLLQRVIVGDETWC